MSPVPLPPTTPLLAPLAEWCLDTFDGLAPLLIGVEFRRETVALHPVELDSVDPISDLVGLTADPNWEVIVLIVDVVHIGGGRALNTPDAGLVAHARNRVDFSATVFDYACGQRRTLRNPGSIVRDTTQRLFSPESQR